METEKAKTGRESTTDQTVRWFFDRLDLQDLVDAELEGVARAREMYAEALALQGRGVPWPEIREHLLKGRKLCPAISEERGPEPSYQITFAGGDKITFDGTNYWFRSRWSTEQSPPSRRPRPPTWIVSVAGKPMEVFGSVVASTEQSAIQGAIKVFHIERRLRDRIAVARISSDDN